MKSLRGIIGRIALAAGLVLAGCWAAYGQTGDCYATLPGCLDPSFGVSGKVSEPAGMTVNGVTIQMVGDEARIVTVGQIGGAWTIARYRPNGTLDTSFGGGRNGAAYAAVVQPDDGMLVVVGDEPAEVRYKNRTFVRSQLTVLRYDQGGNLDQNFGDGGKVKVSDPDFPASPTVGMAVALDSHHNIVVLGSYNGTPAVVRLLPDGTPDSAFSGDGQYVYFPYSPFVSGGFALGVQTIDGEDKVVFAGEDRQSWNFLVFRLTSNPVVDHELDETFGTQGVVLTNVWDGAEEYYEGLAVDSEHRIVAVGTAWGVSPTVFAQMVVARYTQSGALDTTFGQGGIVSPPSRLKEDRVRRVAIQPDGRIVVAGNIRTYDDLYYMSAWRFNADGSPDLSFGNNGWVSTALPGYTMSALSTTSIALQPDGKIVLAGNVSKPTSAPFLARYFGHLPPQLDHDIAVDNVSATPVLATQGEPVVVQVTVDNKGGQPDTATVSLTDNGANITSQSVTLTSGQAVPLTFTWSSSTVGSHTLQATATITTEGITDQHPGNNSQSTTVNVASPVVIALSAGAYRVKTSVMLDLMWNATSAPSVVIYRDGAVYKFVPNTGTYTQRLGTFKETGTYIYKVCEEGSTSRCSNAVTVSF